MTKKPPTISLDTVIAPATNNFKTLLGKDWSQLHPDIQSRFGLENSHRKTTYKGTMHKVKMSLAEWMFANFSRLLGTPLSIHSGSHVPCEVRVYPDNKLGGMTWDRLYFFPGKPVNRVVSTKCIQQVCGLIEVATSGFGMYSRVSVEDGAMVFASERFFCTLGKRKIPIPHLLSPGKTIARQKALSDGRFEFTLHIRHPLLGTVFYQLGIFSEARARARIVITEIGKYDQVAELLLDIECIVRNLNLWSEQRPSEFALASEQPFCVDTLNFCQWLQFVFIERLQIMISRKALLPENCGVAPMAEEYFLGLEINPQELLHKLRRLDEVLAGS